MNDVTTAAAPKRAETRAGPLAYREAGAGRTVLLLHQTPRSSDEYRDVLPLLAGAGFRALAMDTPGFGDSPPPTGAATIETYADAAAALLEALEVSRAAVVGHHTGGVVAFELAASRPELVAALVLSSTPYTDSDFRRERARHPLPDREPFYPADRPDLLERYRRDAARAWPGGGHAAVAAYAMEGKRITAPLLIVAAPLDPFAYPHVARWRSRFPEARVVEIPGGTIPLPDHKPTELASAVIEFLEEVPPWEESQR